MKKFIIFGWTKYKKYAKINMYMNYKTNLIETFLTRSSIALGRALGRGSW